MAREQTAILFRKALGLTDSVAVGTQKMSTNPRAEDAGATEFLDCLNVTTTPDGCIEKVPSFATALETSAPVTRVAAGRRLVFSDGVNTKEWTTGSTIVNRFPVVDGPVVHTPQDVRVSAATKNYKSADSSPTLAEVVAGTYVGPDTALRYGAMPVFTQAFVYTSRLYLVNRTDPRFLQYSEEYGYDLYNLGDNYILTQPILQAGAVPGVGAGVSAIPGMIVATHIGGITVYSGTGPHDFSKKFFPCPVIDGTLYCGRISKVDEYGVVFLGDDGVYFIGHDKKLVNLTAAQFSNLGGVNTSYKTAVVTPDGKYLAIGATTTVEYDFRTKSTLLRATQGVVDACVWGDTAYFASGTKLLQHAPAALDVPCHFVLPYSDLSARGRKNFLGLYFSGTITGRWVITATDQTGVSWSIDRTDNLVGVTGYYIKVPKAFLGNHISLKVQCLSGAFRLEELRAEITASGRSR